MIEKSQKLIGYEHLTLNSDFEISTADVEKFVEMLQKKILESDEHLIIDSLPPSNKK